MKTRLNHGVVSRYSALFLLAMAMCAFTVFAANNTENNGYDFATASSCDAGSIRYQGECDVYLSSSGNQYTLAWAHGEAYVYQRGRTIINGFDTAYAESGYKSVTYEETFSIDGDDLGAINVGNFSGYEHPGKKYTLATFACAHGASVDEDEANHTYHF